MSIPDWKEALPVPPPGGHLHEAWFTTFEPPDAGLLVEHVLPSLLGMSRALSQDSQQRTLFFGELGTTLEALHGRITILSTPPRGERDGSQYPWLWRYIGHFTVGAKSRAVQHAKLWAFHWVAGDDEYLQLHVSSTNLTTSAFKEQIQAGWYITLPLKSSPSVSRRKSWGALVPFLEALGVSAGAVASSRIRRLVTLLERVECPVDAKFIASVPGGKSTALLLNEFGASDIHVMTPTIGDWNARTLLNWSRDIGVELNRVHLKWISAQHPWAVSSGWTMSAETRSELEKNEVNVVCLPNSPRFTKQHIQADARWSHAKLYLLSNLKKQMLLVTSANWSLSAWGAGKVAPRNFELGVVFETEWKDFQALGEMFDPPKTYPFLIERGDEEVNLSPLEWAEATWDGIRLVLQARSTNVTKPIKAAIRFNDGYEKCLSLACGAGSLTYDNTERLPIAVLFSQEGETILVDVIDLRSPSAFAKTSLPEVDPKLASALREAFLLQRYGGPVVDDDALWGLGSCSPRGGGAQNVDYTVLAWSDARAGFHVVDQWRSALCKARGDSVILERVRLDGYELKEIYARREGPSASLVAEELGWLLEENT